MGMSATEKVINDLNVAKFILCNPQMLNPEMCIRIGQVINSAIDLLTPRAPTTAKPTNEQREAVINGNECK